MFEVVTPAASRAILGADELRLAAGLLATDTSQDGRLSDLGLRVADAIARHCNVAEDGVTPPTLLSEVCAETIRLMEPRQSIVLRRRFVTAISSVTEDGVGLGAGSYEIDKASGVLRRLCHDRPASWTASKVIIMYTAGFTAPPNDIKQAAELFLRQMYAQFSRDPLMRRERVDGVGESEYWVGSIDPKNQSPFPSDVAALLAPYLNGMI